MRFKTRLSPVQTLPYIDPLIPLDENIPAKLNRLSLNIATLTHLIDHSQHRGLGHLTAMFNRSRQSKVDEALSCIATSSHEA